ncbi:MAG: hemagglutinin repeat-containing protein, partial [Rhodanobacter sp.]
MAMVGTALDGYRNVRQTRREKASSGKKTQDPLHAVSAAALDMPGIAISYGSQRSNQSSQVDTTTEQGSILRAAGDLTLNATGGDLTVIGSALSAGGTATLAGETGVSVNFPTKACGGVRQTRASSRGNLAYDQMDSDYASATQTSGIAAGNGGYLLNVGGNTDLKGAVIASTADLSKNILSTGSLSYSDIENKAHYDAFSFSISGGYDSGGTGGKSSGGMSGGGS